MINNLLVKKTIYGSLIIQLLTTMISLDGLNYDLTIEDSILKDILLLEAFVQFIEAFFYIWVIFALKDLNKMTSRRYFDWFITTPIMLVSTIIFMEYKRKKEANEDTLYFWDFIKNNKKNIILIVSLNFLMLLMGILSEVGVIDMKYGISLGFLFFIGSFYVIYYQLEKINLKSFLGLIIGLSIGLFISFADNIGILGGNGATAFKGAIMEVVVIDDYSTEVVQRLEGYLAGKWGLLNNLPNDHPYR